MNLYPGQIELDGNVLNFQAIEIDESVTFTVWLPIPGRKAKDVLATGTIKVGALHPDTWVLANAPAIRKELARRERRKKAREFGA